MGNGFDLTEAEPAELRQSQELYRRENRGIPVRNPTESITQQLERLRNPKSRRSALPNRILLIGFLVLSTISLPLSSLAAIAQGQTALSLQIKAVAVMTVSPAVSPDQLGSGENNALVRIDLVVRLNPGRGRHARSIA